MVRESVKVRAELEVQMEEELRLQKQAEFEFAETAAWDDSLKAYLVAAGVPIRVDVSAWRRERDMEA